MNLLNVAQEHVASLYPFIIYDKPPLRSLPPGAIIGTWAYSVPGKHRFILDRSLELATGVLPGDLARVWIRDAYKLPIKRRKAQINQSHWPVPLHARIGQYGDCSYVDINHAYLSVLALGYDLEYESGQYIGAEPRPVPPEIAACKFAYAIAVSMSKSRWCDLDVMGQHGLYKRQPINVYSNPCLFNLAQDTLNGIGAEVLAVLGENVVYANTDGYIVRAGYESYVLDIIRSWGFQASIKWQGDTEVYGVAAYRVGEYRTRRYDLQAGDFTAPMMDREARRWLKTRWFKWSQRLPRE